MEPDMVAPTLYSAFRIKLLARFVGHLVGPLWEEMFTATGRGAPRHLAELAAVMVTHVKNGDTALLPPGADWRTLAEDAFSEAVSFLKTRFGDDMNAWTWGKVHRTQPKHPLSDLFPGVRRVLDPPSVGMGVTGTPRWLPVMRPPAPSR